MKRTLLTMVLVLMAAGLWARPVDPATARSVARQFWRTVPGSEKLEGDLTLKASGLEHVYLFVHSSGTGFVAMSGDDCAEAVLAYSVESPSGGDLNPEVRWWLSQLDRQIGGAVREGRPTRGEYYEAGGGAPVEPLTDGVPAAVEPLVATRWDQGTYYNDSCPVRNGERCYVGCVATAMGQLMKYWNHPYQGRGTHGGVDFGSTRYGWSRMPAQLSAASSTAEVEAVSQLLYHAGKAVNMNYTPDWSGAHAITYTGQTVCSEFALQQYFGYSRRMVSLSRGSYSAAEWLAILKGELSAGRPILYSGRGFSGGHSFLCDGYDSRNRLHFNWGWSGAYDGYFVEDALRPGQGGSGSNAEGTYSMDQDILINIQPEWTVGLPFNEDFSNAGRYWSGSLAAGDTLVGPVVALPQGGATLTWQATGGGTYAIMIDGTPVYSGSDASGSVSLAAYASRNVRIGIRVASGTLSMTSLEIASGSPAPNYTLTLQSADPAMGGLADTWSTSTLASTTMSKAMGEIATLQVRPAEGYHFTHWSDGSPWNPRPFLITGDETLTAHFAPNYSGDTLAYDNGAYVGGPTTYGAGSLWLGARSNLWPDNAQLTAVMYYPEDSGLYKITLMSNSTGSILWEKVMEPAYPGMWNTAYLDREFHLADTESYSVELQAISRDGSTRSARCAWFAGGYSANQPGLRCIFNGLFNPRQLTVVDGSGSGLFLSDTTVLIYADQGGGNRFLAWTDGNTDNPRSVRVVSDTTFTALYYDSSMCYVQFRSNDTTLGRVEATDRWYDFFQTSHPWTDFVRTTTAGPGARFLGWTSTDTTCYATSIHNVYMETPRPLHDGYTDFYEIHLDSAYVMNHDTVTITAHFAPVAQGDTLVYDDGGDDEGGQVAAFSSSSTCSMGSGHKVWGVRYDPAVLVRRNQLTEVLLFTNRNYDYDTVRVYSGGENAPQTLLREQVFRHANTTYYFGWQTYRFSTPVAIDSTQPVWVTISAKDEGIPDYSYYVYIGNYTNNPGGSWVYEPGTGWRPYTVVYDYGVNNYCNYRLSTTADPAADTYYKATWPLQAVMPEVLPYYTVAATSSNNAQGRVSGGGRYRQGTTVTLTASPSSNYYRFLQWQDGNRDNPRRVVVVQDTQFVATFEALPTYTITAVANDSAMGTVSGGGSYYEGATATLTATATAGHRFVQWQDGETAARRIVTVTANATYTATFEALPTYTITAVANDPAMGTVSGSGTYREGTTATLTATPAAGHRFLRWHDGVATATRTVTVTADATYTALFEAIPTYTLTVVANDPAMGMVSGSGTYPEGSTVTLTATPAEGHRFHSWADDNGENPRIVIVTANATYTARFEALPTYTLTVLSNDTAMGTVSGGGSYREGSMATLTAMAKEGHHFVRWQDGSTQAGRTVTVTADATYTATFEADPHEGIAEVDGGALALYPNPATDKVTLVLPWPGTATEVSVLTVDGREVTRTTATGDRCTIDVSGYPVGTYVVRVSADGRRAVGKIEVR